MCDDPKEREPERQPGNSVPFVPYVDSMNPAIHYASAALRGAGGLYINGQVLPPPLVTRNVRYVDLGFGSAREFWAEVVLPTYERFKADPTRANVLQASVFAWQLQDWIWHEQYPGQDTHDSKVKNLHDQFLAKLLNDCPELAWIRDVADAGKHRGLGRPSVKVREVINTWPLNATPSIIKLEDGTEYEVADVLSRVIEYWRTEHFP
jgi:hypothetical protein